MTDKIDQSAGGNYEILKNRLSNHGTALAALTDRFNERRLEVFGKSTNELIGRVNIHTENRCVPVDMAQANGLILFGYHVILGLKQLPTVADVLMLYKLRKDGEEFRVESVPFAGSFLDDSKFIQSFNELFSYYKEAKLVKIKRDNKWIYVAFQIGSMLDDLKVFRFEILSDSDIRYVDDLGSSALSNTQQSDIEWTATTREDHVLGEHPHVNVLNTLFVECVGGDLTIKIENNTEDGLGIYREVVEDKYQVLADAQISYAKITEFILLKVRPHREKTDRYILFNCLTEKVIRLDALGSSCKLLPEDHGLIFPNGYALASGEVKLFDEHSQVMRHSQTVYSPNGEDVLYSFYDQIKGAYLLYSYSLIDKRVASPIYNHGYCRYADGRLVMFREAENGESSKIHALRIWQTPYLTPEMYEARNQEEIPAFYRNSGNAELVRGISDLNSIVQYTQSAEVTQTLFEALINYCTRTLDQYHWLKSEIAMGIPDKVRDIIEAAGEIIGEFVKVQALQVAAVKRLAAYEKVQKALITKIKVTVVSDAAALITLLSELKAAMGELISLNSERYMDLEAIKVLESELNQEQAGLNARLVVLLQDEAAYAPYIKRIEEIMAKVDDADKSADLNALEKEASQIREDLMLVNEEVSAIETEDPTQTTRIIDLTTNVIARLNAVMATLKNQQKSIRSVEADAEFASQFKLLTQALGTALSQIQTPEDCDLQQARILGMVEKLESRFAEFEHFLAEIYAKRDEITTIFENHKQDQLNQYQRRIDNISSAAEVSFKSIENRLDRFTTIAELNSYFISDSLVLKVKALAQNIRSLGDSVRADGLEAKLKGIQDQALRALRDHQDIFEAGGSVIKLGRHRFSVNQQAFDLTLSKQQGQTAFHLTGTEYYKKVTDEGFLALEAYAALELPSESKVFSRSEYLAYSLIQSAHNQEVTNEVLGKLTLTRLYDALAQAGRLLEIVTQYIAPKYREGYVKGVHDVDAVKILEQILPLYREAGLLRISQKARMLALLFLSELAATDKAALTEEAKDAQLLYREFGLEDQALRVNAQFVQHINVWQRLDAIITQQMADYLTQLLGAKTNVVVSRDAEELTNDYLHYRKNLGLDTDALTLLAAYERHHTWLGAYCAHKNLNPHFVDEAAGLAVLKQTNLMALSISDFSLEYQVTGLLSQHPLFVEQKLQGTLDQFLLKGLTHQTVVYPNYLDYLTKRGALVDNVRESLSLNDYQARPLTSFVRNKLISESYLKLIGDNFAKQIGTLGENKRTDLMGMLLLISPPGYGKTTLIEYIANKMGLIFVKINCPSLGHEVVSLDPKDAPNATAAREIEKLNFGLEMGSNVLLYLDDIQHTNPEFLQKFISLCDGTRRIEGVWEGKPKTYDMRGKKFAVVMAGNPYTESGEAFKVPDMLANRADIYNLGDMLSDQAAIFELSYIENALTSNPILAPLATRNLADLYLLVREAQGESINHNELEHPYSAIEIKEIVAILTKLIKVQETLLAVNQNYIASAAMADKYRKEPPFKLQGSYRNMNKLAEKVVSAMSMAELDVLIGDHYQGEAQTLTIGAEENLLKLKEIRGLLSVEDTARWEEIKQRFSRHLELGDEEDPQVQIANQLVNMNMGLKALGSAMSVSAQKSTELQETHIKAALASTLANDGKPDTFALGEAVKQYLESLTTEMRTMNQHMLNNIEVQKLQAKVLYNKEKAQPVVDQNVYKGEASVISKEIAQLSNELRDLVDAIISRSYVPSKSFVLRKEGRLYIDPDDNKIEK